MSQSIPDEWADLPSDPDPEQNLGYKMVEWDVITPAKETDHLIFLPKDEDLLREDAFIVVKECLLRDVTKER
jgi:hypothetical protein